MAGDIPENQIVEQPQIDVAPATPKIPPAIKAGIEKVSDSVMRALTLITEIVIVAFIGSMIGVYLNAKTIQNDCEKVNMAKVGDVFVNCTLVEPKKDAPTQPPR